MTSRSSSAVPVVVEYGADVFDAAYHQLSSLGSLGPRVECPPLTEHAIVMRSVTQYNVSFKVRSSNPGVIVCSPATGKLTPNSSIVLVVRLYLFRRRVGGELFHVIDPTAENVKLKISVQRVSEADGGGVVSAPFDIVVAPFQENIVVCVGDTCELPRAVTSTDDARSLPSSRRASEASESLGHQNHHHHTIGNDDVTLPHRKRDLRTPRKSTDIVVEPFVEEHLNNVHYNCSVAPTAGGDIASVVVSSSSPALPIVDPAGARIVDVRPSQLLASISGVSQPTAKKAGTSSSLDEQRNAGRTVTSSGRITANESDAPQVPIFDEVVTTKPTVMSFDDQRVCVVVRARPLSDSSLQRHPTILSQPSWHLSDHTVGDDEQTYLFDGVLGPDVSNAGVARACGIRQIVEGAVNGINASIILYGQTNSGKTHTMFGTGTNNSENGKHYGVLYYAVEHLFRLLNKQSDSVFLSFVEVYNEEVRDLLLEESPESRCGGKTFISYDSHADRFVVEGLLEVEVNDFESILCFLNAGIGRSTVGVSHLNDRSSRAHTIFRLRLKRLVDNGCTKLESEMNFVDLAGSESLSHTPAVLARLDTERVSGGGRNTWIDDFVSSAPTPLQLARTTSRRETTSINLSLSSLKKVILSLSKQQQPQPQRPSSGGRSSFSLGGSSAFVSYRDSSLTKILKSTLSGNSRVLMICTVSLEAPNRKETKATLQFGTLAKSVPTSKVQQNKTTTDAGITKRLEEENKVLKARIAKLEAAVLAQAPELSAHSPFLATGGATASVERSPLYAPSHAPPDVVHIDAMVEAFEESEENLAKLVSSTFAYLQEGCSAVLLDRSSASGNGRKNILSAASDAATSRRDKKGSSSATTTPRAIPSATAPAALEVTIRLKLPYANQSAEILVFDGQRSVAKVRVCDISRVVLGRNVPELRAVGTQLGFAADDLTVPLTSVVLEPKQRFSSASSPPSLGDRRTPRTNALLTFMCMSERDVEAWVIVLARLAHASPSAALTGISSVALFQSSLQSGGNSSAQTHRNYTNGRPTLAASSSRRQPADAGIGASRSLSAFIVWDVNAMTRRFSSVQQAMEGRDGTSQPSGMLFAARRMLDKELLLCKQQNIDVVDYVEAKKFILGGRNAPHENVGCVQLVSLYNVRIHCRVTLYQAYCIVRLLRDQSLMRERRVWMTSLPTASAAQPLAA